MRSLNFVGSVASIISLGIGLGGGYWVSQSQSVSNIQQVQIVLQQVIADLPPENRDFGKKVAESVGKVLNTASGSESEMKAAARDFRERISQASILSYDVVTSPFPLTLQRTVLLCNDAFSVAYQLDNSNGSQRFIINGRIYSGSPGVVFTSFDGSSQLQLRYMEYLKREKTPILSFKCSSK